SRRTAGFAAGAMAAIALMAPLDARQSGAAGACRITGHATSGTTPLPGVSITIRTAEASKGATSTETDGGYAISLTPGQYTLSAELTGFTPVERPLVVVTGVSGACAQTIDLSLSLAPRQPFDAAQGRPVAAQSGSLASAARAPQQAAAPAGGRGTPAAGRGGRGAGFETVQVQPQADQTAATGTAAERETEDAATRLLL